MTGGAYFGCPAGTAENSPAFQRWVRTPEGLSPDGTADRPPIQPSLRDLIHPNLLPSVETLGYSHPSLRDEQGQTLAALDIHVCCITNILVGNMRVPASYPGANRGRLESPATRQAGMSALRAFLFVAASRQSAAVICSERRGALTRRRYSVSSGQACI
jgi:hypothetical protein